MTPDRKKPGPAFWATVVVVVAVVAYRRFPFRGGSRNAASMSVQERGNKSN
jgi:hypothetical protein